jgi:hypothetical protein
MRGIAGETVDGGRGGAQRAPGSLYMRDLYLV